MLQCKIAKKETRAHDAAMAVVFKAVVFKVFPPAGFMPFC